MSEIAVPFTPEARQCPYGDHESPDFSAVVALGELTCGYMPRVAELVPEYKELVEAFNPLSENAASHIETVVKESASLWQERNRCLQAYRISYDPALSILPPGTFSDKEPAYPATYTEQEELENLFREKHSEGGTPGERAFWQRNRFPSSLEADMRTALLDGRSLHVDPDMWARYEGIYKEHLTLGTEEDMLRLWAYRNSEFQKNTGRGVFDLKGAKFLQAEGRFDSFVYAHCNTGADAKLFVPDTLVMPIGEYGEQFAERLLRATIVAMEITGQGLEEDATRVVKEHESVLREHTARGQSEGKARYDYDFNLLGWDKVTGAAPLATLQEGILSVMQTIALLTANKVPGYDNPDDLLRDIVAQGVIERFTRRVSMGYVGPLTLFGAYYPHPLTTSNGKLELTDELSMILKENKAKSRSQALEKLQSRHAYIQEPEMYAQQDIVGFGIACPAARGGIQRLAEAISEVDRVLGGTRTDTHQLI